MHIKSLTKEMGLRKAEACCPDIDVPGTIGALSDFITQTNSLFGFSLKKEDEAAAPQG